MEILMNFVYAALRSVGTVSAALMLSTQAICAGAPPSAKYVQVYAHRGGRSFSPENSMPAYKSTLRLGADWVDMDAALTKDGEVLITHDLVANADIARGPDGKFIAANRQALENLSGTERLAYNARYAIKNMTLAETQKFDIGRLNPNSAYAKFFPDQFSVDGTRMPPLRDVVRYVNTVSSDEVGFQIEMKTDPGADYSPDPEIFAGALYKIIKEENILDKAEIQAFDFRCLYELQKLDSRVKTAYLTSRDNEKGGVASFFSDDKNIAGAWTGGKLLKDYGTTIPQMVKALGGYAWEPEDAELTKESLDEAHKLGLKVVVWSWPEKLGTAFDPLLVAKMISWGVDGIISDDPGRLSSMLAARGQRVPDRYKLE